MSNVTERAERHESAQRLGGPVKVVCSRKDSFVRCGRRLFRSTDGCVRFVFVQGRVLKCGRSEAVQNGGRKAAMLALRERATYVQGQLKCLISVPVQAFEDIQA